MFRGSTLLAALPTESENKPELQFSHFILTITESPGPIKDRSELVFPMASSQDARTFPSLSERLRQGTGLINALSVSVSDYNTAGKNVKT